MRKWLLTHSLLLCGCFGSADNIIPASDAITDAGTDDAPALCPQDSGLKGSNDNYVLNDDCQPLQGVSITISITQNIITSNGFGLQVNADGLLTSNVAWQQYVLAIASDGALYASVDNWDTNGNQIFNQWVSLLTMPQDGGIAYVPAGYEFTFSLLSDTSSNITGASYTVVDGDGNVLVSYSIMLDTLNQWDGGTYNSADIGPIGDMTLDVVGFDNGQNTDFFSGAGNIIYHAASPLTVLNSPARCTYDWITFENSNSLYGNLPLQSPNGDYVQGFSHCQ